MPNTGIETGPIGEGGLKARIEAVRDRIQKACARAGRSRDSVRLVAVSKRKPADMIRSAYDLGLRDFGENYAQELRDKARQLEDLDEITWHFIGPIQRNKVRYLVGRAALLHAVDSVEVVDALQGRAQRMGVEQSLLVEVHLSGEASKAGVRPEDLAALLDHLATTPNLRCVGLMSMPPLDAPGGSARPYFARLRELAEEQSRIERPNVSLLELSMGMTSDFEAAIEEGATLVRVGTAIFGPRQ